MSPALQSLLDALLARSPAQALFLRRAAHRLTVLAYHAVTDAERFARQLEWLSRRFRPISQTELLEILAGAPPPRRAVLLTFDDGDRSIVELGLPLLARRGVPGVAFVVAGLVDRDAPFWWTEVAELARTGGSAAGFEGLAPEALSRALKRVSDETRLAAIDALRRSAPHPAPRVPQLTSGELGVLEAGGVAIGNHSLTHPCLDRCSAEKIRAEITVAHERLTAVLGHPPSVFAYPNGNLDPRAEPVLAELGYRAGFLFDHRVNPAAPPQPLRLSRVRVNSDTPLDRFAILVSGLHSALHHRLGRV